MGSTVDVTVTASNLASVERDNYDARKMKIEIVDLEVGDVLDAAGISEAIDFFGADDLLAEIGREKAIEHFEIKEEE